MPALPDGGGSNAPVGNLAAGPDNQAHPPTVFICRKDINTGPRGKMHQELVLWPVGYGAPHVPAVPQQALGHELFYLLIELVSTIKILGNAEEFDVI